MANIIALVVTVLLAAGAIAYIVISKKRGKKCIGCPGDCHSSDKNGCKACSYCQSCGDKKE